MPGATRRAALGAGMVAAALFLPRRSARAESAVEAALARLLAGRLPIETPLLRLDVPEVFEQGSTVPLAVAVADAKATAGQVKRLSLFAEGNPFPEVATIHLTAANGRASVATRIRINAGGQEVVALAELADGQAWLARRLVSVTVGGCGVESGVPLSAATPPSQPRVKLPALARQGEIIEVKTMISHRMETGLRFDVNGAPIPRRIIHRMECRLDRRLVFAAELTPAIAANAYLTFPLLATRSATLAFTWHEDGGATYHASHALAVA